MNYDQTVTIPPASATSRSIFSSGRIAIKREHSDEEYEQQQQENEEQDGQLQQVLNKKRKKRRESHNAVEKKRRHNIDERIYELSTLLPQQSNDNKNSKGIILRRSVEHVKQLHEQLSQYQLRIQELENMLAMYRGTYHH